MKNLFITLALILTLSSLSSVCMAGTNASSKGIVSYKNVVQGMIFLGLTSRSTVKHNIKIYKKIIKSIDKKASKAKNGWLNYNERKYIKIQLRNLKKRVKSQSTVFGYSLGDYIFTDAYNAISSGFKATNAKNAAWLKRVNKRILRTLNAI